MGGLFLDMAAYIGDNMSFGKKVSSANVRRLVRRVDWTRGTKYEKGTTRERDKMR